MTATTANRLILFACALAGACLLLVVSAPQRAEAGGSPGADRKERKVVRVVNKVRARHGLPKVHRSRALMRAADYHSWDMLRSDRFAHTSSNGESMDRRVRRYKKARHVGENLAWVARSKGSRRSARAIVRMWMRSPSHRAVILKRKFRRIGIGRRTGMLGSTRAVVYTADFSSRR